MYFYEVFVSSQRYHGDKPLTYSYPNVLRPGAIVAVPLGARTSVGFVVAKVPRPTFTTKAIEQVLDIRQLPPPLIALHHWLLGHYPGPSGITTQLFIPTNLGTNSRRKITDTTTESITLPALTNEQREAVHSILSSPKGAYLLHGETGSGKTRVYTELAKATLDSGKSVIVLTPEIGLTPQLTVQFRQALTGSITVLHSGQTAAERRDNWLKISAATDPQVVIGPRSALFAPVDNIGLIILDECHDAAYKQDSMPYYQASHVAGQLARLSGARLVLGSATPLVSDIFTFRQKSLPIIRMQAFARGEGETNIQTVDLKDRQHFTRSPWLSDTLLSDITTALRDGYQSLLFLNRRGTARIVICTSCGWQATCPRCDLPLTYHGDKHKLQCHTCGFTDRTPLACPECGKPEIAFKSIGTKTLTQEIERLFPDAAIARFDSDTTKSESIDKQFESLVSGKVDIIVGTQMLTKGLDLPLLQVIGVVLADTGLYFPDYSAEERTFQMLRQVIGRVGRGHIPGKVTLQSYAPESVPIKAAINRDYESFYEAQIKERSLYHFPPYYFVLKISVERAAQSTARNTAHDVAQLLLSHGLAIELTGPSPAFVERSNNKYKWQVIVKAKQRGQLIEAISLLPKNCSYDIDPINLL